MLPGFLFQIIDVHHPNRANVPKSELKEQLAKMFKSNDVNCVFVFGFKTVFGGAKTTGFALIYDNFEAALKFEPKYRLIRVRFYFERTYSLSCFNVPLHVTLGIPCLSASGLDVLLMLRSIA